MKSVAVLGASGQLGQTLNYLVKDADGSFQFFSSEEVDITDKSSIENTFQKNQFEFCINCAAYTNVEAAESDIQNAFLVNATGVKNVAEVCKDLKIKLIHISTDYVFDGTKNEPYLANDTTNPISQYGRSKLEGEKHIKEILADYYIIRTSWLYSVYGKNFMKTIINWISKDKVVNITTEETGTPTSSLELGRFILYLATSKNIPYGIYNFSARGSTTWFGFAREIAMRYDSRKINNINSVESFKTKANRPKYSVLDISNTEAIYNKSLKTWQAALSETINLFKSQESIT